MDKKSIKILLIDDDRIYITIIKFWLEAHGYSIEVAYSGEDALNIIKDPESQINIVFLDIFMQEIDGIETLKRIREMDNNLPVIMVTTSDNVEHKREAEKLGVVGFFQKSADFTQAAKLIKEAIENLK